MVLGVLLFGMPVPVGPYSTATWDSFRLVQRLGSATFEERAKTQKQLATNPAAALAVAWGSNCADAEVRVRCRAILSEWAAQEADRGLSRILRDSDGDFDRFMNALLNAKRADLHTFAKASAAAHALDGFLVRNSFPILTSKREWPLAPYQKFSDYMATMKPTLPQQPRKGSHAFLNAVASAHLERMLYSALLCTGSARIGMSSGALIVAGGDVVLDGQSLSTIVIASGDVAVKSRASRCLIVAGGEITIESRHASHLALVTPRNVHVEGRDAISVAGQRQVSRRLLVFEKKSKPCGELFVFRSMSDYGIDANVAGGRVRIKKVEDRSPFKAILKDNDSVIASAAEPIESVGHLRRILSLALDTRRIDLQVERHGQSLRVAGAIMVTSR